MAAIALLATAPWPPGATARGPGPHESRVEIVFLDAEGRPLRTVILHPWEAAPDPPGVIGSAVGPPPSAGVHASPAPATVAPPRGQARPAPPMGTASPAAPGAPAWLALRRPPLLGDGSPAGELLAGAQRLVGARDAFIESSYLGHLLAVAAVAIDLRGVAPQDVPRATLSVLEARDRVVLPASAVPGDLVFLVEPTGGALRAAVVEGRGDAAELHLIGEVGGAVARFVLRLDDPALFAVARP